MFGLRPLDRLLVLVRLYVVLDEPDFLESLEDSPDELLRPAELAKARRSWLHAPHPIHVPPCEGVVGDKKHAYPELGFAHGASSLSTPSGLSGWVIMAFVPSGATG